EFYLKCRSSQEFIYAQIPWASVEAERERVAKDQEALMNGHSEEQRLEMTTQERLLASLLNANEELMNVLHQYDDLKRVDMERMAKEVSRKEAKMDQRKMQDGEFLADLSYAAGGVGIGVESAPSMRFRLPSLMRTAVHTQRYHHGNAQSHSEMGRLVPPPPAPHGPRTLTQEPRNRSWTLPLRIPRQ
ncbi:hypothetical protein H0H87_000965, partial [Tephrocybe sp. NHM501043]